MIRTGRPGRRRPRRLPRRKEPEPAARLGHFDFTPYHPLLFLPRPPGPVTFTARAESGPFKGTGQAGTFTVTPPAGGDHNWLEGSLDGVTWTKVTTSGSSANKAISVAPDRDGTHTLQVRAVDKADNKSEAAEYTFHAGPGGFLQPTEGERTARRLPLVAEADAAKYRDR